MTAITSHRRKTMIAVAAVFAVGAGVFGFARYYPALGPIAGSIAPQLYVDVLPSAQIPIRGRFILVDAASARLYMPLSRSSLPAARASSTPAGDRSTSHQPVKRFSRFHCDCP